MADAPRPPAPAKKDVTGRACKKDVTGKTCTICGEKGPLKCPCQTTRYCSKKCQAVDWRERGHKAACVKIRAEREEEAKRGDAPTPPSPLPVYGPAERTCVDDARDRVKAEQEAARAWREANPEPTPASVRFGSRCPICLDAWDANDEPEIFLFTCCFQRTCSSCADKIGGGACPLCQEWPSPQTDSEDLANILRHVDMHVPEAMTQLGRYYQYGKLGLVKSEKKAMRLYARAAELGDTEATMFLGFLHQNGDGVKLNTRKAAKFYQMAADGGQTKAMVFLGWLMHQKKDFSESARLFGLAAARGSPFALYCLGDHYQYGKGVPKDLDEARRLFALAAAKGCTEAEEALAKLG